MSFCLVLSSICGVERALLWLSGKCEKWPINSQTINTNHKTTIKTLSSEGGCEITRVELRNE
ncbi:hypothetical protein BDP27DRAFT_1272752 [Rhodocollybia butyracea]|uniref:Secreted protein n=1 Tax=Rhodocollybia butyracea TaxID=206335 RepID=A0A9P5P8I7_9AGAR|nr:hypothetical protein BDP27DRAFT_1272752 [Rhodocollybia butyracea]